MIRFSENYVGVDVGITTHPTAMTVLRRCEPFPNDGADQPILEVVDLSRARAIPFTHVAREVRRVLNALDGTTTVGIDGTGPGEGLVQELRRQGVRCVSLKFGGNSHRIMARGDTWSVPSHRVYEATYRLLVQRRLRLNPDHPLTSQLVQEMDGCTCEILPSGGLRYEVQAADSHGDVLVSLGIAALLHEHPYERVVNAEERRDRPGARERRPGTARSGNVVREVVAERLERSLREAEADLWREHWRY